MLRLLKYTKPYLLLIIISIGLLFAQANLELALPDYLSNIVDTGIQQGGIENAVPQAIRQSEMEHIFIFMSPDNISNVLANYRLVDENSTDYNELLDTYPILVNESIYILNDNITKTEINNLENLLIKPFVTVFTLERALANPENATELFEQLGFNSSSIPPITVFFNMLSMLPPENLTAMVDAITKNFEVIGETMLHQVAVVAVRIEYENIGMNTDRIQIMYILKAGTLMLLMTLLAVICTIAVSFLVSRTSAGMARGIRSGVFSTVENFSNTEFDTFSTASLITRSTNDVTQIQMATYMILRMVFYAPILGVGGIIHALAKSKSMWWLIGLAVAVLLSVILVVFFISLPKFKAMQKLTDRLNLVARESLSGMLVIRAFNKEKYEEERFDKANIDLTAVSLYVIRVFVILMPFMMIVMNVLSISILWVGAHKVSEASMQVGDLMAFLQYSMQIVFAFLMLTMMFIILPRAVISGRRINEVLETKPVIKDPENPRKFPEPFKGMIEFRNVSFAYPKAKKNAVENISFTAKPGKMTAFIGPTGAGKSTIVNLIPRFYEVSSGAILIDGIDIREVTQHDLREKIGYIPQKSSLFSGTIETNLLFANENADTKDILESLEIAQAKDFVLSKPEGINSEIAQGGMNVSGGQKQRLSIARALVKKPPIYIFDDSFSQLDFKTDAALRKALKRKTGDSTLLIVTQRVSTVKNADLIIVLDEGKIVGKGTHEELMRDCDVYREIASSQLELEETI
ncbi:MAG: ABC transporter ATP-binding protein [Candidatus Heimdallarchaeaceae archaeon]